MDIVYQIKAFILGIVEGLTEFLPISSTGHLIIAGDLLNFNGPEVNTFSIAIQAGAIFAVCWFYRVKLFNIVKHLLTPGKDQQLAVNIVVAFLPAAVLGVLLADYIEELLFNPITVAIALVIGGLIIFWIENLHAKRNYAPRVQNMDDMTIKDAFLVGCMQCIAMIPGTSRSGCDRILFLFSHSDDFRSNGLFACEDISSRLQRAQLYLDIGYDDRICCRFHCFVCERTDRGQMALALRIVK